MANILLLICRLYRVNFLVGLLLIDRLRWIRFFGLRLRLWLLLRLWFLLVCRWLTVCWLSSRLLYRPGQRCFCRIVCITLVCCRLLLLVARVIALRPLIIRIGIVALLRLNSGLGNRWCDYRLCGRLLVGNRSLLIALIIALRTLVVGITLLRLHGRLRNRWCYRWLCSGLLLVCGALVIRVTAVSLRDVLPNRPLDNLRRRFYRGVWRSLPDGWAVNG